MGRVMDGVKGLKRPGTDVKGPAPLSLEWMGAGDKELVDTGARWKEACEAGRTCRGESAGEWWNAC